LEAKMTQETKYCHKCLTRKMVSEFYKDRGNANDLSRYCKICVREYQNYYYQKKRKGNTKKKPPVSPIILLDDDDINNCILVSDLAKQLDISTDTAIIWAHRETGTSTPRGTRARRLAVSKETAKKIKKRADKRNRTEKIADSRTYTAQQAHSIVGQAKRRGELVFPDNCELCGISIKDISRMVWHHWRGHKYPLDLWAICPGCNSFLISKHDGSMTLDEARQHVYNRLQRQIAPAMRYIRRMEKLFGLAPNHQQSKGDPT
jgi:hypothetical protein